ncbi:MAG: type 1 glutamine amidotransferase [Lentimicrobium sp.]|nr:type 1 glutamine amidotransferase [Lentimicrobium sp.]
MNSFKLKILIFKHIHNEPSGHAEQWAQERGHTYFYHYWDSNNVLNELPEFDLLIIMGGMMGAYEDDTYPWLVTEKKLIREAIESGRKVLGICLGAQLIAASLGARVYKNNHPEIGFHQVKPLQEYPSALSGIAGDLKFFQWHGDTFDLPEGACLIATAENVKNQAFTYKDNVTALQFHPEMDSIIINGLLKNAHESEPDSPWKQSIECIKNHMNMIETGRIMLFRLLDDITSVSNTGHKLM